MDDNEYSNIFVIPQNFTDNGKSLGGMFETRNLVEAIALLLIIGYPELNFLHLPLTTKLIVMAITIFPPCILALIGIDGDSLLQYLGHVISFFTNRRNLHFKRVGYKYPSAQTKKKK